MTEPTAPGPHPSTRSYARSRWSAAFAAAWLLGLALSVVVEGARGIGLTIMILSAALFLLTTIPRARAGRSSARVGR